MEKSSSQVCSAKQAEQGKDICGFTENSKVQSMAIVPDMVSPTAPQKDTIGKDAENEKIAELIAAVNKAELTVPEITIEFAERQGKKHSLQFSLEKKIHENKISLTVGIDSRKNQHQKFILSYFQFNGKEKPYMRFRADFEKAPGRAQDVDSIIWNSNDKCFQLYKKLSDKIHTYYDDVLSYWFNDEDDLRPQIKFADNVYSTTKSIPEEDQRFLSFISDHWPSYDNGSWNRIQYMNIIDDEEHISEEGEEDHSAATSYLIGIGGIVIGFMRKFIINGVYKDTNPIWDFGKEILGGSNVDIFIKKPDVDLNPMKFKQFLANKALCFDFSILDMICTALNCGDNVILTGAPGCGKTSLAKSLLEFSDYRGITATAASTWTTDELIGRYVPETQKDSNSILKFQKGFFLEAIKDKKWLLIDEMNRAPIDQCFGELFSILSGHSVELPFEERHSSEEPPRRIRIIAPQKTEKRAKRPPTATMPPSW